LTVALSLVASDAVDVSARGVWLAAVSGALASGVGYCLWYAALRRLSASRAAIVQLVVPLLAAAGGIVLLNEPLTARLVVAAAAIMGGVALAVGKATPAAVSMR
jgi:drug/metabolite transporter (DMT)-like permease